MTWQEWNLPFLTFLDESISKDYLITCDSGAITKESNGDEEKNSIVRLQEQTGPDLPSASR
jgi:hypothetical protein